ncbi:MAG: extracellular solute-binding protein [Treponema sp.]|jgi:multiple sugar transport system substrate-binding protein|nr:extracellular solute-binding protein [Treponema sp.]
MRIRTTLTLLIFCTVLTVSAAGRKTAAGVSDKPEGRLSISCYDTMTYRAFLEEAVRLFHEQYPLIQVELQTFSAMPEIRSSDSGTARTSVIEARDDPRSRADYISRVSTALMSGEGADIYAMDILPLRQYVERGQLENLEPLLAADPIRDTCRPNILHAARCYGGLWFLPIDYGFSYYAYDSSLIPPSDDFGPGRSFTLEALTGMARPLFSGSAKLFNVYDYVPGSLGGMVKELLDEQYSYFVNQEERRANFDDGVFAALLTSVRDYAESGFILRHTGGRTDPGTLNPMQETDRYFFKINNNFALVNQYGRRSGRRMTLRTAGSGGGIEDDDEIAGVRANRDGGIPFNFSQAYAINAGSRNKQNAWEFLKFLLSEEVQTSAALSPASLPLNNRARQTKAGAVFSGSFMGRGQTLSEGQQGLLENYRNTVEELSDQINCYIPRDTLIDDMIAAEIAYFFNRSRTAEETAAVLHSKVNLYLNEQN